MGDHPLKDYLNTIPIVVVSPAAASPDLSVEEAVFFLFFCFLFRFFFGFWSFSSSDPKSLSVSLASENRAPAFFHLPGNFNANFNVLPRPLVSHIWSSAGGPAWSCCTGGLARSSRLAVLQHIYTTCTVLGRDLPSSTLTAHFSTTPHLHLLQCTGLCSPGMIHLAS